MRTFFLPLQVLGSQAASIMLRLLLAIPFASEHFLLKTIFTFQHSCCVRTGLLGFPTQAPHAGWLSLSWFPPFFEDHCPLFSSLRGGGQLSPHPTHRYSLFSPLLFLAVFEHGKCSLQKNWKTQRSNKKEYETHQESHHPEIILTNICVFTFSWCGRGKMAIIYGQAGEKGYTVQT